MACIAHVLIRGIPLAEAPHYAKPCTEGLIYVFRGAGQGRHLTGLNYTFNEYKQYVEKLRSDGQEPQETDPIGFFHVPSDGRIISVAMDFRRTGTHVAIRLLRGSETHGPTDSIDINYIGFLGEVQLQHLSLLSHVSPITTPFSPITSPFSPITTPFSPITTPFSPITTPCSPITTPFSPTSITLFFYQ